MVRLRTLGSLELHDASGTELRAILVQPRRLALLAALALTRPHGFQRRDRLLGLFWPEQDTDRARASLNRAVHFLRKGLGEGIVLSRGAEEIGLAPEHFRCDAQEFEGALANGDLRRALELYRGDLMPAFFVSNAPGFEEWLESERVRLRARATDAGWTLVAEEEAAGNGSGAAHWARWAVALTPFDDVAVRRLLALLDRSGDRAGAARAYRQFAEYLEVQLGVTPAPETRALDEAIRARNQQATMAPLSAAARRDVTGSAPVAAAPRRRRLLAPAATFAVAAAAVALAVVPTRDGRLDPLRVDVAGFENEGADRSLGRFGAATATRVFDGLVQAGLVRTSPAAPARIAWRRALPFDSVVARSRRVRGAAGTVVSGSYVRENGVLRLRAWITDHRRGDRIWEITPVSGPEAEAGELVDLVRQRLAGGVAVLDDPYYASLLPLATRPPRVEAWQEFREGLRLGSMRQDDLALEHFRLATTLDSGFTWPLVHAALSASQSVHPREARVDSLLLELDGARDRLGPLERHLVEFLLAIRVENWEACYRAIRHAAAIAPDQFSYTQAARATTLHRPREALAALTRPHLASIYREDAKNYWFVLTLSYHQLGEHRQELAAARTAREATPANPSLLVQEMRALAAMGRVAAVQSRADSLLELPRDDWFTPGVALMLVGTELRAHGHAAAAQDMLARSITWYRSRPPAEAAGEVPRFFLGWTLYLAGQLDAADSLFRVLHHEHPHNVDYIGHLGVLAARRGESAAARRYADELDGREVGAMIPGEESIVWRARIAALLGDKTAAMRLLIEAFGPQGTMELHGNRDFDDMRDYAPFREFVRPKG